MPRITEERFERAKKILNKKIGDHDASCTICGQVKRTLHPNIFSVSDLPLKTVVPFGVLNAEGAVFIDLMFTTCNNCGHVDFFNAHKLEALKEDGT